MLGSFLFSYMTLGEKCTSCLKDIHGETRETDSVVYGYYHISLRHGAAGRRLVICESDVLVIPTICRMHSILVSNSLETFLV